MHTIWLQGYSSYKALVCTKDKSAGLPLSFFYLAQQYPGTAIKSKLQPSQVMPMKVPRRQQK